MEILPNICYPKQSLPSLSSLYKFKAHCIMVKQQTVNHSKLIFIRSTHWSHPGLARVTALLSVSGSDLDDC
jgi:hypothetical protein